MKIEVPALEFDATAEAVHRNRDAIAVARSVYQGALKVLEGLHQANVALCRHPNAVSRHDPGYAGGGYSHRECADCGGHLP